MADHEWDEARTPIVPGELFRATQPARATSPAAVDLAEALGGLDRATRDFTRRLGEGQIEVERARRAGERAIREAGESEAAEVQAEVEDAVEAAYPAAARASTSFDRRMREAELEARAYLEAAKRRADSLVKSMVGAVEHEAAEARRDAEESIRARWEQVEVDASRHVENARRVAAQMVTERQARIAKLSDGISGRAEALTAGMDDADRVRAQFDAFVRALAVTADQIARGPSRGTAAPIRGLHEHPRPSAMAA